MKRLFSFFPAGPAGVGLLLIRVACATQLLATSLESALPIGLTLLGAIAAAALAFGVLTQAVAIACVLLLIVDVLCCGKTLGIMAAIQGLDMLALSLLGAGAYSLDAHLFGRRVIHF